MKLRNKKTGEVVDLAIGSLREVCNGNLIQVAFEPAVLGSKTLEYPSLAELNEEWEDYKPKEPLIRDEKVRKAVRAWTEANEIVEIKTFDDDYVSSAWYLTGRDISMDIRGDFPDELEDEGVYTIEELCGEEE